MITDIYLYDFDHVFLDSDTLPWITAFIVTSDYKSNTRTEVGLSTALDCSLSLLSGSQIPNPADEMCTGQLQSGWGIRLSVALVALLSSLQESCQFAHGIYH